MYKLNNGVRQQEILDSWKDFDSFLDEIKIKVQSCSAIIQNPGAELTPKDIDAFYMQIAGIVERMNKFNGLLGTQAGNTVNFIRECKQRK